MSDSTVVTFDVLTKDNYNTWRIQAEALLVVSDLWDYVEKEKELIPEEADSRKLWMKQDKIAKSKLILHISSTLIPLIENCTTSREVWMKLANVYGDNKNSDTDDEDATENSNTDDEDATENSDTNDEDAIINDIENSVNDFFENINDLSEKEMKENKKSLSTIFTDNLFSRLNMNSIEKLPDKQIIVNTISDFIDFISKLSKIEINEQKNELSNKLIDILLVKFNINPHENDNDDAKSNPHKALSAEIRSKFDARDIVGNQSETINLENEVFSEDESICSESLQSKQQFNNYERTPCESYGQEELENPVANGSIANLYTLPPTPSPESPELVDLLKLQSEQQFNNYERTPCESYGQEELENSVANGSIANLYTPPPTPSPQRTYKCGVCREEGHNRRTCPTLNKPAASAPEQYTTTTPTTPKRSYKCGVCHKEGHNRTTCPLNKPNASASEYTAATLGIPKISSSKSTIANPATPRRSYKCGVCHEEGHNRTTCPSNKPNDSASKYTAATPEIPKISSSRSTATNPATATPKRSYKCGVCHEEGHNRTTCPSNKPNASASEYTAAILGIPKISSSRSTATNPATATPKRSYKCGVCHEEGHNRTSCPSNKPAPPVQSKYTTIAPETPKRSYKCGGCGNEGHNIRSCPWMNSEISSPKPATIRASPAKSYTCGSCGEEGHNRTTCPRNYVMSTAPTRAAQRCGNCGGEGHNRRTCGRREASSVSYSTSSYSSYSSPAPSSSGGGRKYTCGNCGGSGHNRRTCTR